MIPSYMLEEKGIAPILSMHIAPKEWKKYTKSAHIKYYSNSEKIANKKSKLVTDLTGGRP